MANQEPEERKGLAPGPGLGVGIALGVAIGVAIDNLGAGMVIGLAIGAGVDAVRSRKRVKVDATDPAGRRRIVILILAIGLVAILLGALVFMLLWNG